MVDTERALLTKAIQTGQLEKVISHGISTQHFASPECREVWDTCVDHLLQFHSPPSFNAVKVKHPDFGFIPSTDALEYILQEFSRVVKRREAIKAGALLMEAIDDPKRLDSIEETFLENARMLSELLPQPKIDRFSSMYDRIAEYHRATEAQEDPHGIPFGIPTFDEMTFGIKRHEYVSIAGWQGKGKSSLLQYCFFNAYLNGYNPLMISLEMEASELMAKWDAMATNFEMRALQAFELGDTDIARWEIWADRAAKASNNIVVLDDLGRNCTVDKVHAEIMRYKPDIVGIDYISLMDPPKAGAMWEQVTYLTRTLKRMARSLETPIIGIAQTNIDSADEGAKLSNLAYSRSIGQDSDIVLGLHQDEKMEAIKQMEVRMMKNRRGPKGNVKMHWDMDNMYFREWEHADMFTRSTLAAVRETPAKVISIQTGEEANVRP